MSLFRCFGGLGRKRNNFHDLTAAAHLVKGDMAVLEREQGMILTHADIGARMHFRAALTDDDVAGYDELAADRGAGQVIQDLAALRAGFLLVDNSSYADMRTRLEPLTAAERPFRYSARELLALSAWKQGDMSAARQWTDMIVTDPQTPSGARSRAQVLSELIAASGKG